MKNIIIIGSRGYNYPYGGWETFVTNLIDNTKDKNIKYYLPNLTYNKEEEGKVIENEKVYNPYIYCKDSGFKTMFSFTIKSINFFLDYIEKNNLKNVTMLILGCKVGPLIPFWQRKLKRLNVKTIINPDGLEWKRDKWSWWIKECFKISERYSIKYTDECVCDSKAIEKYVKEKYQKYNPKTHFIAYGAYLDKLLKKTKIVKDLFKEYNIQEENYYLIVGRFIPENNYETIIKEFMKSSTKKDLVIICNLEKNKFYTHLLEETDFESDKRVKFVGSIYDNDSLRYIRKNAYAYIHGHSAGGTNPSLLEALSLTNINILYDVDYNNEVGLDSAYYFNKDENNLKELIDRIDLLSIREIERLGNKAKERIKEEYTWDIVVNKYNKVWK